ncbi:unnamed protein product, partial [Larinioides sclopetarius]
MTRNGKLKVVSRKAKPRKAVERREKKKAMAAFANGNRLKVRYSTDAYTQEFVKYLKKIKDEDMRNQKEGIKAELEAKGIDY